LTWQGFLNIGSSLVRLKNHLVGQTASQGIWGETPNHMDLLTHLAQKKSTIVKQWFDRLTATYPPDTTQFLRNQKDRFANPVGQNSLKSLNDIFDHLLMAFDRAAAQPLIDPIIRIRAIQNFTAAQAVCFVFDLKDIIRDVISTHTGDSQTHKALADLDKRIDHLGLLAFDIYMQCREKIYDLKANETKNRIFNAFDRAGLIKEPDDERSS
jgi:hypothetical protein